MRSSRRAALAVLSACAFTGGIAAAVLAQGPGTVAAVTACATVSTPAHTIQDGPTPLATIPGDTATRCETSTYTVSTVTVTAPGSTTTPGTTTTPTTTTAPPPPPPPPTGPLGLPKFGEAVDANDMQAPLERQQYQVAAYQDLHVKVVRLSACGNPSGGGSIGVTYTRKFTAVGIRPLCLIATTPGWNYPTAHPPADMGNECRVAAQNFADAGAIIEPINEPDLHGWTGHGREWEPYQKACYNAVKAVDPKLVVLFPGMFEGQSGATDLVDFVRDYYVAGGKPYYQAMNVHPYGDPAQCGTRAIWAQTFGCAGSIYASYNVRQQMNANGDQDKPIVATEAGTSAGGQAQATVYQHSLATVDGIGTGDHKLAMWLGFTLYDDPLSCCPGFGIVNNDATRSHRPAYDVFRSVAATG